MRVAARPGCIRRSTTTKPCVLTTGGGAFCLGPPAGFAEHPLLRPSGVLFIDAGTDGAQCWARRQAACPTTAIAV